MFVSAALILVAVAVSWRASDFRSAVSLDELALLGIPITMAALVAFGIRVADGKLAHISSVRPDTGHAFQVPELAQAAVVAFIGSLFSGTAYVAAAVLDLPPSYRWIPPVLLAGPELVVMYYFARRLIDIDMLRPDVRPWFLTAMLTLGSAGMATAKFFTSQPVKSGQNEGTSAMTIPLIILAVFAWIGMSWKRSNHEHPTS